MIDTWPRGYLKLDYLCVCENNLLTGVLKITYVVLKI